ncbi:hypothetical protein V6Z11_D05G420500 [Gossypium hirsutum]
MDQKGKFEKLTTIPLINKSYPQSTIKNQNSPECLFFSLIAHGHQPINPGALLISKSKTLISASNPTMIVLLTPLNKFPLSIYIEKLSLVLTEAGCRRWWAKSKSRVHNCDGQWRTNVER